VVGRRGGPSTVKVHQNASVLVSRLRPGASVTHQIGEGRGVYAYLIAGQATFDGVPVEAGDAAKVTGQESLTISATWHGDGPQQGEAAGAAELILVDVPLQFRRVGVWADGS
jgi:redox-sensitive bicupin YhaK (pirin superfamily)